MKIFLSLREPGRTSAGRESVRLLRGHVRRVTEINPAAGINLRRSLTSFRYAEGPISGGVMDSEYGRHRREERDWHMKHETKDFEPTWFEQFADFLLLSVSVILLGACGLFLFNWLEIFGRTH